MPAGQEVGGEGVKHAISRLADDGRSLILEQRPERSKGAELHLIWVECSRQSKP